MFDKEKISIIKRLLKIYGCFAVLHVAYKIFYPYYQRIRLRRLWKHLPGKDCDPLAREMRNYAKTYDIDLFFQNNSAENYGSDIVKQPTPTPSLIFNTPRAVKWLLKDEFKNITKPGNDMALFALLRNFLGNDGIFNLQHGEKKFKKSHEMWHKQRKISSLIFTKSNFMNMFYGTFDENADRFTKVLSQKTEEEVDIQDMFFSYTMDSIEKFFMGVDVNTIEGGMSEYAKAFDGAHKAMMKTMADNILTFLLANNFLPFPFGSLMPKQDPITPLFTRFVLAFSKPYSEFRSNIKKLDKHIYQYIKETREAKDLGERKDIIANFLNSSIGHELSDKTLRDIVLNLTIAGRDTTACALSWLFYELTNNLPVQKNLIAEIDEVLEGKAPTLADLDKIKMPYLNGCVYEALRMHPPVPNEQKSTIRETTYLDGTVIPAKTPCFFNPKALGRNPEAFPSPNKFMPERWIPFKEPTLYEFPVFQAGPRFCLGKDLAQFEIKLLTVKILQKFSFTISGEEAQRAKSALMLTNSVAIDEERNVSRLNVIPHLRNI